MGKKWGFLHFCRERQPQTVAYIEGLCRLYPAHFVWKSVGTEIFVACKAMSLVMVSLLTRVYCMRFGQIVLPDQLLSLARLVLYHLIHWGEKTIASVHTGNSLQALFKRSDLMHYTVVMNAASSCPSGLLNNECNNMTQINGKDQILWRPQRLACPYSERMRCMAADSFYDDDNGGDDDVDNDDSCLMTSPIYTVSIRRLSNSFPLFWDSETSHLFIVPCLSDRLGVLKPPRLCRGVAPEHSNSDLKHIYLRKQFGTTANFDCQITLHFCFVLIESC